MTYITPASTVWHKQPRTNDELAEQSPPPYAQHLPHPILCHVSPKLIASSGGCFTPIDNVRIRNCFRCRRQANTFNALGARAAGDVRHRIHMNILLTVTVVEGIICCRVSVSSSSTPCISKAVRLKPRQFEYWYDSNRVDTHGNHRYKYGMLHVFRHIEASEWSGP